MRTAAIKQVAATGDITTIDAFLFSAILSGGSDAATAVVRAGGASGTVILTLKVATLTTIAAPLNAGALCAAGIHVTLTGTSPAFTAVYS